jgi:hypothetical protein
LFSDPKFASGETDKTPGTSGAQIEIIKERMNHLYRKFSQNWLPMEAKHTMLTR